MISDDPVWHRRAIIADMARRTSCGQVAKLTGLTRGRVSQIARAVERIEGRRAIAESKDARLFEASLRAMADRPLCLEALEKLAGGKP